jgi:hypothetical protein
MKNSLVIFFGREGIVFSWNLFPNATRGYFQSLRETIRRKYPERWRNRDWLINHDKAAAPTALSVLQFLAAKNMPVISHPPDWLPCDLLLPRITSQLRDHHFQDIIDIRVLPKRRFERCFQQRQKRWTRRTGIALKGVITIGNKDGHVFRQRFTP